MSLRLKRSFGMLVEASEPTPHPDPSPGRGREDVAPEKRKQALLVEDHALFREGLALLLRWRMGLESVEAGSLDEGRQALSDLTGMVDLAIISVDLSDGDGCELIEQLHKTRPDVPVLALTADRSLARQAQALEARADEVLAKMTPVEQIIGAVKRLVGG